MKRITLGVNAETVGLIGLLTLGCVMLATFCYDRYQQRHERAFVSQFLWATYESDHTDPFLVSWDVCLAANDCRTAEGAAFVENYCLDALRRDRKSQFMALVVLDSRKELSSKALKRLRQLEKAQVKGTVCSGDLTALIDKFSVDESQALELNEGNVGAGPAIRRVVWKLFSRLLFEACISKAQTTLVFIGSDVDVNSECMFQDRLSSPRVQRLLAENKIATLKADSGHEGADSLAAQEIMVSLDFFSVPLVAIYSKGSTESPVTVRGLASEDELIAAINDAVNKARQSVE